MQGEREKMREKAKGRRKQLGKRVERDKGGNKEEKREIESINPL